MTRTIEVRDAGPVDVFRLALRDEPGGVYEVLGPNGAGKSCVGRALQALQTGRGSDVPVRDGATFATVQGLGARLTIGRRSTRSGELEVVHLDGLDPSVLVDPGLKEHGAADAERIRQLCRLARADTSPAPFQAELGDDALWTAAVRPQSLSRDDLPSLAASVKRDLEAAARVHEAERDQLQIRAQGMEAAVPKDLPEEPIDRAALGRDLEEAASHLATVQARRGEHERATEAAADARNALDSYGGAGSVDDLERVRTARAQADERVAVIERELAAARQAQQAADQEFRSTIETARRRAAAERAVQTAQAVQPVSDDELAAARQALEETRVAASRAEVVAQGQQARRDARVVLERASRAAAVAGRYRDAAAGCDRVLAEALAKVCPPGLRVHAGRLLYQHAVRGEIPFAELSQGEAFRLAIPMYARELRGRAGQDAPCMLVIRQEAWESLDPANKAEVRSVATAERVDVIAQRAAEGELRLEEFRG